MHWITYINVELAYSITTKGLIGVYRRDFIEIASARARYLDSVLDWATAVCFLKDQKTKLFPTNT